MERLRREEAEEAKRLFGPNLQGAVEFCLATERGEEPNKETQESDEHNAACQCMISMGFKSRDITVALERAAFSMKGALHLLLHGLEAPPLSPPAIAAEARAKRRTARQPERASLLPILNQQINPAFEQYSRRARARFGDESFQVCDLGMNAGMRTNACFWLSFAAGWTRCVFDDAYFDANPFPEVAAPLVPAGPRHAH